MKNFYPSLIATPSINKHTESKIMDFLSMGKAIYYLLHDSLRWEKHYTIIHDVVGEFYWIKELKGIKFDSLEEAKLYCFLHYCEKMGMKVEVKASLMKRN